MLDIGQEAKLIVLSTERQGKKHVTRVNHKPCRVVGKIDLPGGDQQNLYKVEMLDGSLANVWHNQLVI